MSAVLGVARREVHERRLLLAAAAILGVVTGILRTAPPSWTMGLGESATFMALLAFPAGAALAVGSSLIGRDLAERRLSFYFSRPLSAGALWAGKFFGGAALVTGAFACCYLPALLGSWRGGLPIEPATAALLLLFFLGLMGLAHVAIVMYRSGSRLFALDLGLAAALAALLAVEVRHLTDAGAGYALAHMLVPAVLPALAIATVVAARAQLLYGGADPRRGHAALSVAVWSLGFTALAALVLWGRWILAVTPAEVAGVGYRVLAAPRGSAVFFSGSSRHGRAGFSPVFLMDTQSGAYRRYPVERMTLPVFSADGRMAAWVAPSVSWWSYFATPEVLPFGRSPSGVDLAVARLDGGTPAIQQRAVDDLDPASTVLAVDAEARRVLVSVRSSVLLVDVDSGRVLQRLPLPEVMAADFLPGGVVRLYVKEAGASGRAAFVVLDWAPTGGDRTERARWAAESRWLWLAARGGDLAVVSAGSRVALLDAGRGGAVTLDSGPPSATLVLSNRQAAFVAGNEVRIMTSEGRTVATIAVEPRLHVHALRETAPGELAVGLWTASLDERRTVFFDAATGKARHEERELLPAGPGLRAALPEPEPGSPGSRLFVDPRGGLVMLDPSGARRTLVPPGT